MRISGVALGAWLVAVLTLLPVEGWGDSKGTAGPPENEPEAVRVVVDGVIARENELSQALKNFSPRIETYLQGYKSNDETGDEPTNDFYFFGRLDFATMEPQSFLRPSGSDLLPPFVGGALRKTFTFQHTMDSFVEAALVDYRGFSREHYKFRLVRSEFLGTVRCLVF